VKWKLKKAIQKNQGNKSCSFWMRIEIDTEPNNKEKEGEDLN
jgi:hypothetical protein